MMVKCMISYCIEACDLMLFPATFMHNNAAGRMMHSLLTNQKVDIYPPTSMNYPPEN
jgi:hypothetical protein